MIAFASVFLMKVASKWNAMGFNVDSVFVWALLERMIHLLKTTVTSERHLLHHIAAGLENMLARSRDIRTRPERAPGQPVGDNDYNYNSETSYNFFNKDKDRAVHASNVDEAGTAWNGSYNASAGASGEMMDDVGVDNNGDFDLILNNNMLFEAFGSDSANDVYNLLSSQFSF